MKLQAFMKTQHDFSRRKFMGGLAATVGYFASQPGIDALAQNSSGGARSHAGFEEYDALAKLSFNENPYGPSASVLEAMTHAFKFANRYGAPDSGLVSAIATHHGVEPDNVLLGAG